MPRILVITKTPALGIDFSLAKCVKNSSRVFSRVQNVDDNTIFNVAARLFSLPRYHNKDAKSSRPCKSKTMIYYSFLTTNTTELGAAIRQRRACLRQKKLWKCHLTTHTAQSQQRRGKPSHADECCVAKFGSSIRISSFYNGKFHATIECDS